MDGGLDFERGEERGERKKKQKLHETKMFQIQKFSPLKSRIGINNLNIWINRPNCCIDKKKKREEKEMSFGFFKGTTHEQDARFGDKNKKYLSETKFPPEYENKVDLSKVKLDAIMPWVTNRVTQLVGSCPSSSLLLFSPSSYPFHRDAFFLNFHQIGIDRSFEYLIHLLYRDGG